MNKPTRRTVIKSLAAVSTEATRVAAQAATYDIAVIGAGGSDPGPRITCDAPESA